MSGICYAFFAPYFTNRCNFTYYRINAAKINLGKIAILLCGLKRFHGKERPLTERNRPSFRIAAEF